MGKKRRWVKLMDSLVDVDAFVLFRKGRGWRQCVDSAALEQTWTIEAFPGPQGGFAVLEDHASSAAADANLRTIHDALTSK